MKKHPKHILAVAGIVKNDENEILLVHTKRNRWVYPGGQVEVGEDLVTALEREIMEESGITVDVLELIGMYSNTATYPGYNGYEEIPSKLMMDFVCQATGGSLKASDETDDCKWVAEDEVLKYLEHPTYIARFQAYLEKSKAVQYLSYVSQPAFRIDIKRTF